MGSDVGDAKQWGVPKFGGEKDDNKQNNRKYYHEPFSDFSLEDKVEKGLEKVKNLGKATMNYAQVFERGCKGYLKKFNHETAD